MAGASNVTRARDLMRRSGEEHFAVGAFNVDNQETVENYRSELGVEMYINLDHSPSVEAARAGIDAGFEFIHIDYSQAKKDATDEEIIEATRAVVDYAADTTACTVATPSPSSSISTCWRGSGPRSTSTSACMAEAARRDTTSSRPRRSASARSTSTPTCATPIAPRWSASSARIPTNTRSSSSSDP